MDKQIIRIVSDIDLVLTRDSDTRFHSFLSEKGVTLEKFRELVTQENYDLCNIFHSNHGMELEPMPGAKEVLTKLLLLENIDFVFHARTFRNKVFSQVITEQWMNCHFENIFKTISCTEFEGITPKESKGVFCKNVNAHIFIDDSPSHVREVAETLPNALIMLYNHKENEHVSLNDFPLNVTRVNDWEEIYNQIFLFTEKIKWS